MADREPYYLHTPDRTAQDPGTVMDSYTWKPLEFLNAYRFLISVFFVALFSTNVLFPPLASMSQPLFLYVSVSVFGLEHNFCPDAALATSRIQGSGFTTTLHGYRRDHSADACQRRG